MFKISCALMLFVFLVGCQSPEEVKPLPQDKAIFEAPLPPKVDSSHNRAQPQTPRPEEYQSPLENKAPKTYVQPRHQVEHQSIVPWIHNRSNTNNVGVGSVWSF